MDSDQSSVKRIIRALLILVVVGVVAVVMTTFLQGSRSRKSLAKYKAELRAKGEKLSAEELGYPRPLETRVSLDRLLAAANKVGAMRFHPSTLDVMPFVGPGQVEVVWAPAQTAFRSSIERAGSSVAWEEFTAQFTNNAEITRELREAVRTPPRYFYNDPTNIFNAPKSPFVSIRNAAQWLGADAM